MKKVKKHIRHTWTLYWCKAHELQIFGSWSLTPHLTKKLKFNAQLRHVGTSEMMTTRSFFFSYKREKKKTLWQYPKNPIFQKYHPAQPWVLTASHNKFLGTGLVRSWACNAAVLRILIVHWLASQKDKLL